MKRHISLAICSILLIIAMVFLPSTHTDVNIGAGKGKNEKVETLDNVTDFIEFLSFGNDTDRQSSMSVESPYSFLAVAIGDLANPNNPCFKAVNSEPSNFVVSLSNSSGVPMLNASDTDTLTSAKPNFTSGTMHQTAYVEASGEGASLSMNRTLSLYISEEASYYHSKASMSMHQTLETESRSVSFVFDIEIYVDSAKTLLKFHKFNGHSSEESSSFSIPKDVLDKWIDFTEVMPGVDASNREDLSMISDMIQNYKEDGFVKNGDTYELKSKYGLTDDIKIDLSNPTKPSIDFKQKIEESGIIQKGDYLFSFENINNTVVKLEDNVEIYDFDDFDMEGLENVF